MAQFLISLDEIDRVKRANHIGTTVELAKRTDIARSTWARALATRKPTPDVLEALANLGARPTKILVLEDPAATPLAAA
ncbi:XRE family transcriptional regulator [Corynebacterium casei]|uniref:XRE family transcriptional regulator n=1 Tax=Corynebacterium casei TaxID=160386 RepID=UPI003FD3B187